MLHRTVVALVIALLTVACGQETSTTAPPPPSVTVIVAKPQSAANIVEIPGRVQAFRTAEVRARVDGIVQRRLYQEGSDVREGARLFLIDPRELRASLNGARAALERARATAANAQQDVERYKGLVEDRAISKQEYDAAVARLRTAQADVAQATSQLESAQLNLDYTLVTAPISGRAGRARVTEGALVSASAATLLTTIEQLDPVYVNFAQSSAELLQVRQDIAQGRLRVPELRRVGVTLSLENGTAYPHRGHLDFLDLSIDEETGTVALRAQFPNPDTVLLPGQFVRAHVEAGTLPNIIRVPQRAVQLSANSANVLVVGKDGTVASRPVKLGALNAGSWTVLSGLQAGERVIIEGLQKVAPGQKVRIATSAAAAAPAPAR